MADRLESEEVEQEAQWRTAGDRIQTLLDASAASGAVAHERAEQLVREVTDLYGAGLDRMMRLAVSANPELAEAFTDDQLVASLLLVHDLHPHGVERRVSDALDSVRPYLGSHGGDVHLIEVADGPDGGIVRLQFSGSCKTCPSSSVTLELAVEDAIRAAAPEVESIEVVAAEQPKSASVISPESLMNRLHTNGADGHSKPVWHEVPGRGRPGARGGGRFQGRRHHGTGVPGRRGPLRLPGPVRQLRRLARRGGVAQGHAIQPAPCCDVPTAEHTSTSYMPDAASTGPATARCTWSRSPCWSATGCCRWRSHPMSRLREERMRRKESRDRRHLRRAGPHPG